MRTRALSLLFVAVTTTLSIAACGDDAADEAAPSQQGTAGSPSGQSGSGGSSTGKGGSTASGGQSTGKGGQGQGGGKAGAGQGGDAGSPQGGSGQAGKGQGGDTAQAGTTGQGGNGQGGSGQGGDTGQAGTTGQGGDTGQAGTTGQGGNGQGGDTGQAGTTGQGGDTGQAGTTGQGGDTGQGGTTGQGGDTGQAGTTGQGGDTGQGGSGQGGDTGQAGQSAGGSAQGGGGQGGPPITAEAVELCNLVNEYRQQNGLPAVPLSTALMTVAAYHVQDLGDHPETQSGNCNLHSWSDNPPLWSGCCYTPDHAQAQCMWDKPRQITASWGANTYTGNGYEDASAGASTPAQALDLWKNSPSHNDVILNNGIWASYAPWPAVGCGMLGSYAVLWFGDASDPQTYVP